MRKSFIFLAVAIGLVFPRPVFSKPIDVISDLQKQRIKICREIRKGNDKEIRKNLKNTGEFIEQQIKKSSDPELMRRIYSQVPVNIRLATQAEKVGVLQMGYVNSVYLGAISGLRIQYRNEIHEQTAAQNFQADFFEANCRKLNLSDDD